MNASGRRALHYVFKVGDRKKTAHFFRNVLLMKFLRHEEFKEGCKASCNGPYDGQWSKSMVGYGPEDDHFVVELTYNYGLGSYAFGNDFQGITIHSSSVFKAVKTEGVCPESSDANKVTISSPSGYTFHIVNKDTDGDPVQKVSLASSDIQRTYGRPAVDYWVGLLQMNCLTREKDSLLLSYGAGQCNLEFNRIEGPVEHAKAFGRIAFSSDTKQLEEIQSLMEEKKQTILTPFVRLETPGKADVVVVILADPDGHEICFVGDSGFRELSQVDPKANELLNDALEADKSDEWYAKKGKHKASA